MLDIFFAVYAAVMIEILRGGIGWLGSWEDRLLGGWHFGALAFWVKCVHYGELKH